jgi:hypothetical protein
VTKAAALRSSSQVMALRFLHLHRHGEGGFFAPCPVIVFHDDLAAALSFRDAEDESLNRAKRAWSWIPPFKVPNSEHSRGPSMYCLA